MALSASLAFLRESTLEIILPCFIKLVFTSGTILKYDLLARGFFSEEGNADARLLEYDAENVIKN
jgi:hypothetical protein